MVAFVACLNQDRFWYIWHSSTQAGKYLVVSTLIYFFYFFIAFKITSVTILIFFWDVALEPNPTSQGFYNGLKKYVCS